MGFVRAFNEAAKIDFDAFGRAASQTAKAAKELMAVLNKIENRRKEVRNLTVKDITMGLTIMERRRLINAMS